MIKAEMVYTLEDMKLFAKKSSLNKYTQYIIKFGIIYFSVCFLILCFADTPVSFSVIMLFVCIVAFILMLVYLNSIYPKNNYKKFKNIHGDSIEYFDFNDDYFVVQMKNGNNAEYYSLEYNLLNRAEENKNAFYIYISPLQAYIVRKNSITYGTPEDLTVLLRKHLGKKFKSRF